MTDESTQNHVEEFMASMDPDNGFLRVGDLIANAVRRKKSAQAGLEQIKNWIAKDDVSSAAIKEFKRVCTADTVPDPLGGRDGLSPVLAAAHARAHHVLRSNPSKFDYREVLERLNNANDYLEGIEKGFVGQLLVSSANRIRYDDGYYRRYKTEIQKISKLTDKVSRLEDALIEPGDNDSSPGDDATPRASSRCTINGRPAPCGLVVVIIVIIVIVSKVNKAE